jgi:hypothetical protein
MSLDLPHASGLPATTSTSPGVTLAVTVHQPDDRLVPLIEANLPGLAARYAAVTAYCSRETHPAVVDLLRAHGANVQVNERPASSIHGIGPVRRQTVRLGLTADTSHLQMCDFDRAIHWAVCWPRDLGATVAGILDYDLLVLGRTDRAWSTHPPYQAETEPLFNQVFSLVTGRAWDVGAGSRGLSRRAARTLLEISREMTVGVDAEWPLLLLQREGFRVGYRRCEGLEFETADRFAPEIEAAGSYRAWEAQISAEPERWVFRLQVALLIAEAAVRYGWSEP